MRRISMEQARTLRTPCVRPLLVTTLISALALISGCRPPEPKPQASSGGELIVWVVDSDPEGIAIALNDIKNKVAGMEFRQYKDLDSVDCETCAPTVDMQEVLRELLAPEGKEARRPFRISWGPDKSYSILFKFATPNSLVDAWKPLFQRCVGKEPPFQRCVGKELPWPFVGSTIDVDWIHWLEALDADLKRQATRGKVVILGPDWSDAVPALWFHLADLERRLGKEGQSIRPPVVSTSTTWSLLYHSAEIASPVYRQGWAKALSRSMGFTDSDLAYITDTHQAQIHDALASVQGVAAPFIQYAEPDNRLVEALYRHLVEVQGFRRVAILYRDTKMKAPGVGGWSPGPERKVYGPALRDDFRERFKVQGGCLFLDAPYPEAPPLSSSSAGTDEEAAKAYEADFKDWKDWRDRVERQLRSVLRYFEREGIEAVGVFGDIEEKIEVLKIVREKLPRAQLFTSDADWRLEASGPPPSKSMFDSKGEAGKSKSESGPTGGKPQLDSTLDGLLIVTSPQPTREWVRDQFIELNFLNADSDQVFLPSTYTFYTSHVVSRLVELVWGGKVGLLLTAVPPPGRTCVEAARDPGGPNFLECYLRLPSQLVEGEVNDRDLARVASGRGEPQIMLIQDGRLRPLAESGSSARYIAIGVIVLLGLFYFLVNPGSQGPRDLPPITPVEWLVSQGTRGSGDRESPPDRSPPGPLWRLEYLDTRRVVVVIGAILLIGLLVMWIDAHCFGLPVSMALIPDGHSVLPSLLIMGLATVLAYYLPHRFRSEFNNRGLLSYRTGSQEPAKAWSLRRWVPPFKEGAEPRFDAAVAEWVNKEVNIHLQLSRKEARRSAVLALILVLLEVWAGLPMPFGISYMLIFAFEFFLWWTIIAVAWTMSEMVESPAKLEGYLSKVAVCEPEAPEAASKGSGATESSQVPRFGLRHLDLVSAGRVGTIFIESITYLLLVFGLLLVARQPAFGMAHWRWGTSESQLGVIFATVALVFIIGFWLQCYGTLQGLIRSIKRDRLEELEDLRFKALEGKSSKEQEEASVLFEARRRSIEQVSEQPWEPSESRRAWIALLLALLPPVLTSVIGQWSGSTSLMQFLRSLLGQS